MSSNSGAARWTFLLKRQRLLAGGPAEATQGLAEDGLGRRLASSGRAPDSGAPDDPWTTALHRKDLPGTGPTLVAIRETAENMPDTAQLAALLEERRQSVRAGDEEAVAASVRALPDAGFRSLVAELLRREGYEIFAGEGPDADVIDLEVKRGAKRYLVNCQLRADGVVGTAPLMEMAKVVRKSGSDGAFVVAEAEFTPEATLYARGGGLILIDRPLLIGMVVELALEDARRPTLARRIGTALHPELGHELRHLALRGFSESR